MRNLILAAASLSALTAATSAFAQNAAAPADSNDAHTPAMTQAAPATPSQGPAFATLQPDDMLTANVVGLDIYNGENKSIGKIQDVAFDSSEKVTGYILSVGGFLGMGTHYVAVSPSSVSVKYDTNKKSWLATMNATKDQLKAAPEFKYDGRWSASRS